MDRCNSKFIILLTAKMNDLLLIIDLIFETLTETQYFLLSLSSGYIHSYIAHRASMAGR